MLDGFGTAQTSGGECGERGPIRKLTMDFGDRVGLILALPPQFRAREARRFFALHAMVRDPIQTELWSVRARAGRLLTSHLRFLRRQSRHAWLRSRTFFVGAACRDGFPVGVVATDRCGTCTGVVEWVGLFCDGRTCAGAVGSRSSLSSSSSSSGRGRLFDTEGDGEDLVGESISVGGESVVVWYLGEFKVGVVVLLAAAAVVVMMGGGGFCCSGMAVMVRAVAVRGADSDAASAGQRQPPLFAAPLQWSGSK